MPYFPKRRWGGRSHQLLIEALGFMRQRSFRKAEKKFREILKTDSNHINAWQYLGIVLLQQRKPDKGIEALRRAADLAPQDISIRANLAVGLADTGNLDEAIRLLKEIQQISPNDINVLAQLGNILAQTGRYEEAANFLTKALSIKPDIPSIQFALGQCLIKLSRATEAIPPLKEAARVLTTSANVQAHLGIAYSLIKDCASALPYLERAVALSPEIAEYHINLAATHLRLFNFEAALQSLQTALRFSPHNRRALGYKACALCDLGRYNEATLLLEWLVKDRYKEAKDAQWLLTLLYLLKGDYKKGWKTYEARQGKMDALPIPFNTPQWFRESLEGKTLLLWSEQGLGDTIQFIRFVSLLQNSGGKIIVRCQPSLVRLLERVLGADRVFAEGASLPAHDFNAALMSLPFLLDLEHEDQLRVQSAYLFADPDDISAWRKRLSNLKGLKVGIVWRGNPDNLLDYNRSCPAKIMARLADIDDVSIISLQYNPAAGDLDSFSNIENFIHIGQDVRDMADTAAALCSLDLLITIETSVAHLAGALGIRCWIVLPFNPDWRWQLDRADSPWYSSVRLFRQPFPNMADGRAWIAAIDQVSEELKKLKSAE